MTRSEIYEEIIKEEGLELYTIHYNIYNPYTGQFENYPIDNENEHVHSWKSYKGFVDQFDFCEDEESCGLRREYTGE